MYSVKENISFIAWKSDTLQWLLEVMSWLPITVVILCSL